MRHEHSPGHIHVWIIRMSTSVRTTPGWSSLTNRFIQWWNQLLIQHGSNGRRGKHLTHWSEHKGRVSCESFGWIATRYFSIASSKLGDAASVWLKLIRCNVVRNKENNSNNWETHEWFPHLCHRRMFLFFMKLRTASSNLSARVKFNNEDKRRNMHMNCLIWNAARGKMKMIFCDGDVRLFQSTSSFGEQQSCVDSRLARFQASNLWVISTSECWIFTAQRGRGALSVCGFAINLNYCIDCMSDHSLEPKDFKNNCWQNVWRGLCYVRLSPPVTEIGNF